LIEGHTVEIVLEAEDARLEVEGGAVIAGDPHFLGELIGLEVIAGIHNETLDDVGSTSLSYLEERLAYHAQRGESDQQYSGRRLSATEQVVEYSSERLLAGVDARAIEQLHAAGPDDGARQVGNAIDGGIGAVAHAGAAENHDGGEPDHFVRNAGSG